MDPRYKSRYRRQATLVFDRNKLGGTDPVAVEDGRPVFWKGDPRTLRLGVPVECIVADTKDVSFALPKERAAGEPDGAPEPSPEGAASGSAARSSARPAKPEKKAVTGLKRAQLREVTAAAERRARATAKKEVRAEVAPLHEQIGALTKEIAGLGGAVEEAAKTSSTASEVV